MFYTYHITFDHTSSTDGVPSPGSDGQRGSLAICLFIHIITFDHTSSTGGVPSPGIRWPEGFTCHMFIHIRLTIFKMNLRDEKPGGPAAAARYRDKIESLERQNKELQEEVKLLEKYRLERWHGVK